MTFVKEADEVDACARLPQMRDPPVSFSGMLYVGKTLGSLFARHATNGRDDTQS